MMKAPHCIEQMCDQARSTPNGVRGLLHGTLGVSDGHNNALLRKSFDRRQGSREFGCESD